MYTSPVCMDKSREGRQWADAAHGQSSLHERWPGSRTGWSPPTARRAEHDAVKARASWSARAPPPMPGWPGTPPTPPHSSSPGPHPPGMSTRPKTPPPPTHHWPPCVRERVLRTWAPREYPRAERGGPHVLPPLPTSGEPRGDACCVCLAGCGEGTPRCCGVWPCGGVRLVWFRGEAADTHTAKALQICGAAFSGRMDGGYLYLFSRGVLGVFVVVASLTDREPLFIRQEQQHVDISWRDESGCMPWAITRMMSSRSKNIQRLHAAAAAVFGACVECVWQPPSKLLARTVKLGFRRWSAELITWEGDLKIIDAMHTPCYFLCFSFLKKRWEFNIT